MIDIIIASYKEPNSTLVAVNKFLEQKTKEEIRVTVVDPFPEVEEFLNQKIKDKRFNFFLDPGEGKSYALNILFEDLGSKNSDDIFILTDGDVYVSDNSIEEIKNAFNEKKIGCITGKPVPIDKRDNKYGYWSHLLFSGIDRVRKNKSEKQEFFECSGYLFAIRKGVIFDFPMEVSEDSIIPFLFWKKGYQIKYLDSVEVYVKNPSNWKDWKNQKIRNIKGHENLNKIAPDMPRTKSISNEIIFGTWFALTYPRSFKEFFWTIELFFARLYIYLKAFRELKNKSYQDGWREVETPTTKILD